MRLRWKRLRGGRELRARLGAYLLTVSLAPTGAWRYSVTPDDLRGETWEQPSSAERSRRAAQRTCERAAFGVVEHEAVLRYLGRRARRATGGGHA